MCAINGFNFAAPDIIRQMNARTNHRGPDQTNVLVEEGISLGHNRLSIIDLSVAAGMPMESHDGRYVIVYNGELYNYLALRDELAAGYPFRTASDTEVILAAYARWGVGALERFNGMFAFAVWDRQKKELTVARDQAGIKPLYYYWQDGRFIFSSEIKAILEHPAVPRRLSAPALNHYLRALYVPGPLTMFSGINKLLPGQTARLKAGELTIEPYCVPSPAPALTGSSGQMAELVARTIDEAVRRQLVSDRPVGVYLSGGIDSSVVLDAMSRERSRIDTFSVGYDLLPGENADKFNQDFIQAGRTARHYGTRHHEVLVSPKDVIELFEKTVWHMDEPISKPNAIAMMKLAHFVKPTATVVLGGDGGDEDADDGDELRETREDGKRERVGHAQDDECQVHEDGDGQAEEQLSARPLRQFPVDQFGLVVHVQADVPGEEAAHPGDDPFLLHLQKECQDENDDEVEEEVEHRSRNPCGEEQ